MPVRRAEVKISESPTEYAATTCSPLGTCRGLRLRPAAFW